MAEVVLLGDINVDVHLEVPTFPAAGGDVDATHIGMEAGGSVANTAAVLAGLGLKPGLIGRTGDDAWAERALQSLAARGVDIRGVHRDPQAATGLIFIPFTPDGERTMFSYRGANTHLAPADVPAAALSGARLLHLSGYALLASPQREAAWHAVTLAAQAGVAVSIDIGLLAAAHARQELLRLAPRLAVCVLGMAEARSWLGVTTPEAAVAALQDLGIPIVGLKLGKEGGLIAGPAGVAHQPAFAVRTVDATGAGDAFCAGLLYAWLQGWSLPAALVLANALGGLATTVRGGGAALPGRQEVINLLRTRLEVGAAPVPELEEALQALEG